MPEAIPQFVDAVIAACEAGVDEAVASLVRAFQGEVQLTIGSRGTLQSTQQQLDLQGAGLLMLVQSDRMAFTITIPATKGFVPSWCAQPDLSGESRLATLAQELGMNLLPEDFIANDFRARWVRNMAEALQRGGVLPDAVVVPLDVRQGGQPVGTMGIVWPVANPEGLFAAPMPQPPEAKQLIGKQKRKEQPTLPLSSRDLPPYTRSLLRIKLPVVVTLAEKRQTLSRIIELGPGSIIQFDKSCEEMLNLEVGNQAVACGEAVKVGDKFGLRITAMVLPEERFSPIAGNTTKKSV